MHTHKSCDRTALARDLQSTNVADVMVIFLHHLRIDWRQNFDGFKFKATVAAPWNGLDKDKPSFAFLHTSYGAYYICVCR